MDFNSTVEGSLLEGFFPKGWDIERMDKCIGEKPEEVFDRQEFWNEKFNPIMCDTIEDLNTYMGHEIAIKIKEANDKNEKLAIIFPVGPMGMYKWAIYFLKEWNVNCSHVTTFNMDEWSDKDGNTLEPDNPASFQYAMEHSFFNKLGTLTVPKSQRNYATKENLPLYADKIAKLKEQGAKLILVFGIGRVFHIAFWEPHFAADYTNFDDWKKQTHRIAAKLHPLTVEQNALTSFKSRTTLVPCRANTIGPGLFLQADYIIGGCDGIFSRGMQWQGLSLWVTLRYSPDIWVPSSFIPTMEGRLFFHKELAGPLEADCN